MRPFAAFFRASATNWLKRSRSRRESTNENRDDRSGNQIGTRALAQPPRQRGRCARRAGRTDFRGLGIGIRPMVFGVLGFEAVPDCGLYLEMGDGRRLLLSD